MFYAPQRLLTKSGQLPSSFWHGRRITRHLSLWRTLPSQDTLPFSCVGREKLIQRHLPPFCSSPYLVCIQILRLGVRTRAGQWLAWLDVEEDA